ncbi:hypothetical protein, partial [Stieleria mannarensis]|uniref:hypothetical protein n=1 Tax=Stieleria mannarensis TaxID=2755585 RepID=UPI001C71CDE3
WPISQEKIQTRSSQRKHPCFMQANATKNLPDYPGHHCVGSVAGVKEKKPPNGWSIPVRHWSRCVAAAVSQTQRAECGQRLILDELIPGKR